MAKSDKLRAARDLFSVSLDLDLIDFKLQNVLDDLEDGWDPSLDGFPEEKSQVKDLKERTKALRKLCESIRIEWERVKKLKGY